MEEKKKKRETPRPRRTTQYGRASRKGLNKIDEIVNNPRFIKSLEGATVNEMSKIINSLTSMVTEFKRLDVELTELKNVSIEPQLASIIQMRDDKKAKTNG